MPSTYFDKTKDNPPSTYLQQAIKFLPKANGPMALDMGSGGGRDTRFLVENGFKVTSVDAVAKAGEYIKMLQDMGRAVFIYSTFEDFAFHHYDLINASYSLPFVKAKDFPKVWQNIVNSLKPGGILVIDLFGTEDSWNEHDGKMNFHTKAEVQTLLNGLKIHTLDEVKNDGSTAQNDRKFWHVFHIIAQKKPGLISR